MTELQRLDAEIAKRREELARVEGELDGLTRAREIVAGKANGTPAPTNGHSNGKPAIAAEASPPPLDNGARRDAIARAAAARATRPAANLDDCDKHDDGGCAGELGSTSCPDCGALFQRCDAHGGKRGSGGAVSAHRRWGHCGGGARGRDDE